MVDYEKMKKRIIKNIKRGYIEGAPVEKYFSEDRDIALNLAENDGIFCVENYMDSMFLDDFEVMYLAYLHDGISMLTFVSQRLRDDYDFMLMAVSRNGNALRYASKELQNNEKLIRIAEEYTIYDEYAEKYDEDSPFSAFEIIKPKIKGLNKR